MRRLRRVWCPQDAQDAVVVARATLNSELIVRSRRRGRHRITRQNPDPLRVHDFKDGIA